MLLCHRTYVFTQGDNIYICSFIFGMLSGKLYQSMYITEKWFISKFAIILKNPRSKLFPYIEYES